ncbi:hypothetical protein EYF80_000450 [Liparis tanakae]|uniref:Uncharacterized protein n=1 Tax=Liparis tanakae TaxID=230148 RepID=A0A4Z2JIU0_9TELE|nr:hypothetical protein EYF80_000450 [Liparis tanakae]
MLVGYRLFGPNGRTYEHVKLFDGVTFLYMYTDHSGVSEGTNAADAYLFVSLCGPGVPITFTAGAVLLAMLVAMGEVEGLWR